MSAVVLSGRWSRRVARVAGVIALMLLGSVTYAAPDPTESVRGTTRVLLERLDNVQPLYKTNPERFFSEVEKSLAPHVDFVGFSRGVMAKHYRKASDAQRARFAEKFRTSLIRTYAKALVEFDNQRVEVKPGKPSKKPGRATVRLEIHGARGVIYPVDYTLVYMDEAWKLRNVVIDGINIGLQFRSQFAESMRKHRDIDAVISAWDVGAS